MTEPRKFAPTGPLALEPRAFGMLLLAPYQPPAPVDRGGVSVVAVRGPLEQFRSLYADSYEAICERVDAALLAYPRALVLSIASPGGLVAGVFEAADRIRQSCASAGVPLFAYVDGSACSAAYALACAASRISAPPSASVGSIGVIAECVDASAQLAQMGVAVRMVSSGASKSDGDPRTQASGPALTRMQSKVDELAEVFFAHVAARRPMTVDAIRALDAGVFLGVQAQQLGLVDDQQTLDELLGAITATAAREDTMSTKASKGYEDAIAALRKCASSDDAKEAAKAKRMLAAELAEDDPPEPDEDDKDDKPADKPADEKGEVASPPAARAPSSEAALVPAATAAALAVTVNEHGAQLAELRAARETEQKAALFAGRPDLQPSLVDVLAKQPYAEAKKIVDAIKKPAVPKPAAAATVAPTRGEGQGDMGAGPTASSPHASEMDVVMGFAASAPAVRREGSSMVFSAAGSVPASKGGAK